MYSQIQIGEGQFSIPHSSVDTQHDPAVWSIPEPKALYLESGSNNPYVNVKKYIGFQILNMVLQTLFHSLFPIPWNIS